MHDASTKNTTDTTDTTMTTTPKEQALAYLKHCLQAMPLYVFKEMLTAYLQSTQRRLVSAEAARNIPEHGTAWKWLCAVLGDPEDHKALIGLTEDALKITMHNIGVGGADLPLGDIPDYDEAEFVKLFMVMGGSGALKATGAYQDSQGNQDGRDGQDGEGDEQA